MNVQHATASDAEMLAMMQHNNALVWECLYDKYAAAMYGVTLRLTDDETLAEEILVQVFVRLKTSEILLESEKSLCLNLLQHTYLTAKEILKHHDIPTVHREASSMLDCLVYKSHSIAETAAVHALTPAEVKQKLRSELKTIRSQYSQVSRPEDAETQVMTFVQSE